MWLNATVKKTPLVQLMQFHAMTAWSLIYAPIQPRTSQVVLVVKNPPGNAGDVGSIPWSGKSPGGGYCNPHQYSCLENPLDRGAWRATVHRVGKSRTWLERLSMHAYTQLRHPGSPEGPEMKYLCLAVSFPSVHLTCPEVDWSSQLRTQSWPAQPSRSPWCWPIRG